MTCNTAGKFIVKSYNWFNGKLIAETYEFNSEAEAKAFLQLNAFAKARILNPCGEVINQVTRAVTPPSHNPPNQDSEYA